MSHQSNYLKNLSKNLNKLRTGTDKKFTDLRIKIEGTIEYSLLAHRCVLNASNAVLFKSKLDAVNVPEILIRLDIQNLQQQHIDDVFTYLYTGDIKLNANNAKVIYLICGILEIEELKYQCVERMITSLNVDNCFDFWRFGQDKRIERLKTKSLTKIGENFRTFFDNNSHSLKEKEVEIILENFKNDPLITHEDRYAVLSDWFQENYENSDVKFCIDGFLKRFISFEKMGKDFISEISKDEFMTEHTNLSNLIISALRNFN